MNLRSWFVLHFVVDILFAIPLLFFPSWFFSILGLPVEVIMGRLVGAALVGIGGVSFLVRNKSKDVFSALLSLKLLWSACAVFGLLLSIMQGASSVLWFFVIVFAFFFCVWFYFKQKIMS